MPAVSKGLLGLMNVVELVSNALGLLKELIGLQSKKFDQQNTQDMKDAEQAKTEEKEKDRVRDEIATGDIDGLRKDIAE